MAHTLTYLLHALVVLSVSLFITIDAAVPTFLVPNPDGSTAPRSVSEDEIVGTSILTLEGQDKDEDRLTFSIVSQTPTSPPFELESVSGLLKVPSGLDAEFSTSYTFIFGVRDGSTTTNSTSYVVNIVDVNDNAPVFNQPTYSGTLFEKDPIGNGKFAKEKTWKEDIVYKDELCSNTQRNRNVDVGVPNFLVPVASTAPRSVSEDEAPSTSILTLKGQDTDGDDLTFIIVSQTPTSPPFELETVSGILRVPRGLDAEYCTSYSFIFGVRDGFTITNSVSFVVNIVDVNDNAPVFSQSTYHENVQETVSIGTSVITVTATDADVSGNTITYRIVSGNSPAAFALDPNTGVITVSDNTVLNATAEPTYILTIQANDGTFDATIPAIVTITGCTT